MARSKFRAEVEDVNSLLRKVLDARTSMDRDLRRAVDELGDDAELIYASHALKNTGRMARGIRARRAGNLVLVEVHARNPQSGYDYVGVTRFGHKVARIYPRHAPKAEKFFPKVAKAFPLPGIGFRRSIKGFAALKTPLGFFRSVRGFHPASDWADRAWPQVVQVAHEKADALGLELVARFR